MSVWNIKSLDCNVFRIIFTIKDTMTKSFVILGQEACSDKTMSLQNVTYMYYRNVFIVEYDMAKFSCWSCYYIVLYYVAMVYFLCLFSVSSTTTTMQAVTTTGATSQFGKKIALVNIFHNYQYLDWLLKMIMKLMPFNWNNKLYIQQRGLTFSYSYT